MNPIKLILLSFLLFFNIAIGNDKVAQEIADLSKASLYNLDHEQLTTVLKPYLNKNKNIQALVIKDAIDDSIFLSIEYKNKDYIFSRNPLNIPKELNRYRRTILYEDENIGTVDLYIQQSGQKINFTQEEKLWIRNNTITVGVEPWAPIIYSTNGKNVEGITGDILELMIKNSGMKIEVITDFWDPLLESFKNKKIDLLPATYYTDERATYGLYSNPYYKMLDYIYVKSGNYSINSLNDLKGKKLAIPKGFGTIPKIENKFPTIEIVETRDLSDSIIRLLKGEVDALYEGQIAVEHKIREDLITGIKGIPQSDFEAAPLHFFSKIDEPILQSILQKSFDSIPVDVFSKIKNKWLIQSTKVNKPSNNNIDLTIEEENFLQEHQIIKISSETDYPPFDFTTNNIPDGYSIDFLNLLASKIGFEIEYVTDSWGNLLKKIENKEIDVIHTLKQTKEREAFLNFTDEIIRTNEGIFTRNMTTDIKSYKDFNDKTIGLTKGEAITTFIQKNKSRNFEIKLFDNYEKLVLALSYGEVDAIVLDVNVGQYLIKKNDLYNINVVGDANNIDGTTKDRSFRIAVRDDYLILKDILNKGIKSLTNNEIQQLKQKWFGSVKKKSKENNQINDESTSWFLITVITVFLLVALFSLFIIRFLSDRVIAKYFGSKYFKTVGLVGMSTIVILILLLAFHTLEKNRKAILLDYQNDLHFVLKTTTSRLDTWIHDRKNYLLQFGRDPKLVKLTEKINKVKQDKNSLVHSYEQQEIRNFFEKKKSEFGDSDFSIISKNSINLASKEETIIGSENIISKYRPELLKKVFNKEALFIPAIPSEKEFIGKNARKQLSMFFAVPIQDNDGNILSVLTQKLNIEGELSNIIQSGYMGKSGESYILNKDGFMLSKSRFREELSQIGLLEKGEKEYEKLTIRDPGGNLLKGYNPTISLKEYPLTYMANNVISLSHNLITKYSKINSNISGYRDYRGVRVLGAWIWNKDLEFGITSEIDEEEALKTFYILQQNLWIITGLTLLLTIISTLLLIIIGEKATRNIQKVNDELNKLVNSFDENVIASKTDAKGIITYASKEFCKINGYSKEELIGTPLSILRHPDTPKSLFKDLWKTIQSGKTWRGELKNKRKDNSFYWVEMVANPEFDANGNTIGYGAIQNNITSRKKVEELSLNLENKVEERTTELKKQQERFELTIAGSGDGLWEYNLLNNTTWYSPLFKEILGFKENEFDDSMDAWQSRVHPEDLNNVLEVFKNHLKNNAHFDISYRIKRKDDSYIWIRSRAKSIRDNNGQVTQTSGSITDITKLKDIEEEISQNKLFLDALLDSQEQIVITTDGKTLRSANKKFLDFFGMETIDEFKKDYDCICDKFIDDDSNNYLQKFMGEVTWIDYVINNSAMNHKAIILKDGHNVIFSVTAAIMPVEDGSIKSAVFTNITEMENAKIEIEKTANELQEKLDELNRFQSLTVNRELKMIELKKEINQLLEEKEQKVKYKIVGSPDNMGDHN